MNATLAVVLIVVALAVGFGIGYVVCVVFQNKTLKKNQLIAAEMAKKAMDDVATAKKEAILEAKEKAHQYKEDAGNELRRKRDEQDRLLKLKQDEFDKDTKTHRAELQRLENRVITREEQIGKREEIISNRELQIEKQKAEVDKILKEVEDKKREQVAKLEKISGLTKAEAKKQIMESLVEDARKDAVEEIKNIENEARDTADKKAREVIVSAIQRISTDVSDEISVSVIPVPNDETKGRLIGKEGRNIRAIEAAAGVDLLIDDTPEVITISSFDPYRREIARIAIEKMILDGRVNPARIEEIVSRTTKDLEVTCKEIGDKASYDAHVNGLNSELLKTLGRLKFRTSYGQNVLRHSVEVSLIAGSIAVEIGANEQICRRGGLLHDIGKASDHEKEGTHVSIGVELAKKCKESEAVVHCIEAHHGDVPFNSIEAIIVQVADAISSSRPGARRESSERYVKRLTDLENIARARKGVEKCYAMSAGREIRVIVQPAEITDTDASFLAKDIAKEIETTLQYPGQVKVNVIREIRAIEFAK
ncbi:MAG: ribonuclease Y [Christensenellaceae bacterium]|jgi:ribonuclease Y|nr:ribonuclease Y [Christensenellaceae bacterium]